MCLQVEGKDQVSFCFFCVFFFVYALLLVLVSGYRRIISEFSFTTEWEIFPFSVAYRLQGDIVSYTVFLFSKNIFWWNSRRERHVIFFKIWEKSTTAPEASSPYHSLSVKQPIICWANWLCFSSSDVTDNKINLMRIHVRKCGLVCWCHSSSCAVWSQSLFSCHYNRSKKKNFKEKEAQIRLEEGFYSIIFYLYVLFFVRSIWCFLWVSQTGMLYCTKGLGQ